MSEAEWKTRKERIDKRLRSLPQPWIIIPWKESLDTAKLTGHAVLIAVSLVLFFIGATASFAHEDPILISKSRSPDGKLELWIQPPDEDEGEASGTVEIRQVKNGSIMSTFEWSGFGVHAGVDSFIVLWRPDSKFFAIRYEEARGWVTGRIYGLGRGGQYTEVKLPSDEYTNAIKRLAGVSELYGKGCECPEEWLLNGMLTLDFADRSIVYDNEDLFKEYIVTLRVADQKDKPLPMARIASILQRPKEETEHELRAQ